MYLDFHHFQQPVAFYAYTSHVRCDIIEVDATD